MDSEALEVLELLPKKLKSLPDLANPMLQPNADPAASAAAASAARRGPPRTRLYPRRRRPLLTCDGCEGWVRDGGQMMRGDEKAREHGRRRDGDETRGVAQVALLAECEAVRPSARSDALQSAFFSPYLFRC